MRLICPNCGAQYEVDPSVVPDAGRDVQCSNCGHTWFQTSLLTDAELAQEQGLELQSDASAATSPSVAPQDAPSDAAIETEAPEPVFEQTSDPEPESEAELPLDKDTPKARSAVSESVRDILAAEVEFDHHNREHDANPLETQAELGLPSAAAPGGKTGLRDRMARLRGLDPASASTPETTSNKRRDLLPDIEEINSTLSASSERNEDGSVPDIDTRRDRAQRSGFRMTFALLIIVASLLVLLYIFAPTLSAKVPALQAPLELYVAMANGFRDWLDTAMSAASERLNALLSQLNGS